MSAQNNLGLWDARRQTWRPLPFDLFEQRGRELFGESWRAVVCKALDVDPRTLSRWKAAGVVKSGPVTAWLVAAADLKDAGELEGFLAKSGIKLQYTAR